MKTKMLLIEDAMLNEVVGGIALSSTTYNVSYKDKYLYSFTSSIDPALVTKVDAFLAKFSIDISLSGGGLIS
jgi:hypothetical protein